jgi:AraC family transcriptional regulator
MDAGPVAVSLGSPSFSQVRTRSVEVVSAWFPAHTRLDMHTHQSALFGVMLDGAFATRIMNRDAQYRIGSAWTEPAEERHANVASEVGARVIVMHPTSGSGDLPHELRHVLDEVLCLDSGDWVGDAWRLEAECRAPDALTPLVVEGTALSLLARAARLHSHRRFHAGKPTWVQQAADYLHAHMFDAVEFGSLAEIVGVQPSRLARGFRAHYGVTPGDYLRRLRLEWSAARLRDGKRSIASVCMTAGFFDQSHFTRMFRRHFGVSPAAWQRAHGVSPREKERGEE